MFWFCAAFAGPDVYGLGLGTEDELLSGTWVVDRGVPVTGTTPAGSTSISVSGTLPVGTLVLVHQTVSYAVQAPNFVHPTPPVDLAPLQVGQHEFARVVEGSGSGVLVLDVALELGYDVGAQVVPVQEFRQLTVPVGIDIFSPTWDGSTGGIVALAVQQTLALEGRILANGRGFGGRVDSDPIFRFCSNGDEDYLFGAEKGAGVVAPTEAGRGSVATAGGGGNCANSGGGGGGHVGGGGRGGFTAGESGVDLGGLGGASVVFPANDRLVFGASGGTGDADGDVADNSRSGSGGGLLFLRAREITGAGRLGTRGYNGEDGVDDGASGGGAGGTIRVQTALGFSCMTADVSGGKGGDVIPDVFGWHGPGGGGGGGFLSVDGPFSCTDLSTAGTHGVYHHSDGHEYAHGSTAGGAGVFLHDPASPFIDSDGDGSYLPGDCDDDNPNIFPGAIDGCDGIDTDCDGDIDEDAAAVVEVWPDGDGDTHGAGEMQLACGVTAGFSLTDGDCDDANPHVHPGASEEVCNFADDDCDLLVDEDAHTFEAWVDHDGDGFGHMLVQVCALSPGIVGLHGDCDEMDPAVNPHAADDVCNGVDDDCDDEIDEDAGHPWFTDLDGDHYGTGVGVLSCDPLPDRAPVDGDCDDHDGLVNPGGTEVCNHIDDDCDQLVDEHTELSFWLDEDGDTYGAGVPVSACEPPAGYASRDGDCADHVFSIHPHAEEVCNQRDDDCDGLEDEGHPDPATWYFDGDGDGWGDDQNSVEHCVDPGIDWVLNGGDCADADPNRFPSAVELCNNQDDDCDGHVDIDADPVPSWYDDLDTDGYGAALVATGCTGPPGTVDNSGDCDDGDGQVHPDAIEVCNHRDDDCDGQIDADDPSVEAPLSFLDGDGDGFGAAAAGACEGVGNGDDCDDGDPLSYPGALDIVGDGIDQDCDGLDGQDTDLPHDTGPIDTDPPPTPPTPGETGLLPVNDSGCRCSASTSWWSWVRRR